MEKLVKELCELLEVDALPLKEKFEDMAEWDSLNALCVIALLDSNYKLRMEVAELHGFRSILEFIEYVIAHKS